MKSFNEVKKIKEQFLKGEISIDKIDKETQDAIALLMKQEIEMNLKEIEKNEKEIEKAKEHIENTRREIKEIKAETERYEQETEKINSQIAKMKKDGALKNLLNDLNNED